MSIRVKCRCSGVELRALSGDSEALTEIVKFSAVLDGSAENKKWSVSTPMATMVMQIDNPSVQGQIKPGRAYFLDITPAE